MRWQKFLLWCFSVGVFLLLIGQVCVVDPCLAQEEEEAEEDEIVGEKPSLRVHPLRPDFRFNAMTSKQVIINETNRDLEDVGSPAVSDSIANLITVEPEEGEEPEGRTVVRVLADKDNIIVTARCYDESPQSIVSFSKARDSELESEDHVIFVLDTFMDGRSGYVFAVNPAGARFDGLVIEQGDDVSSEWDTIWEANTFRDDSGWYAEIKIPVKSLSYKKGLTEWGFNIQRNVPRLEEVSRWSGVSQDYEIYQTSQAGLLTQLPRFDFGVGLSIRSAVVGSAADDSDDVNYDGDFSLDMTQRLGPNLLSSLTVNTDFAE
ncbi:carbohydrate binding family 9 domain-containing protein, partial [bacterium]|nr:carbohydrate binding family 9 domain-containing protein [bacterium]